jgi:hypothetical protein
VSEGYDVRLASALKEEGYDYTGMARLIKVGELIRVRHGAYAVTPADDALTEHRRLIVATLPRCGDVCLSHASAAVLHSLPTWAADLEVVPRWVVGIRGDPRCQSPASIAATVLVSLVGLILAMEASER